MTDRAHLEHHTSLDEIAFENADLSGINLAGKELSTCVFRGVDLTGTVWRGALLDDCLFEGCDLSNVRLGGASLRGATFRACKLIGTSWSDFGTPPVVSFADCNLRYLACTGVDLRRTELTRCSIVEARFVDVNLTKSVFADCDLAQTTFERCTLTGADFVTSTNVYFDALANRAKGARISLQSAGLMATALGLVVK